MSCNNRTVMFEALSSREEVYALQWQRTSYGIRNQVIMPGEAENGAVLQEALQCRDDVEKALHYIPSPFFSTLHTTVEISQLHALKDEKPSAWSKVSECQLRRREGLDKCFCNFF